MEIEKESSKEDSPNPWQGAIVAFRYGGSERHGPNRLSYWLQHEQWPLSIAAALIANVDPDSLEFSSDRSSLLAMRTLLEPEIIDDGEDDEEEDEDGKQESSQAQSAKLKRYCREIQDLERLLGGFNPKREFATPTEWITAALDRGTYIPWLAWAKWEKLVRLERPRSQIEGKPLSEKERQSMLKLIATLCAMQNIDMAHPSKSAMALVNECQRLGLSLSEGTVSKYLKDARNMLPTKR